MSPQAGSKRQAGGEKGFRREGGSQAPLSRAECSIRIRSAWSTNLGNSAKDFGEDAAAAPSKPWSISLPSAGQLCPHRPWHDSALPAVVPEPAVPQRGAAQGKAL